MIIEMANRSVGANFVDEFKTAKAVFFLEKIANFGYNSKNADVVQW